MHGTALKEINIFVKHKKPEQAAQLQAACLASPFLSGMQDPGSTCCVRNQGILCQGNLLTDFPLHKVGWSLLSCLIRGGRPVPAQALCLMLGALPDGAVGPAAVGTLAALTVPHELQGNP